MTVAGNDVMPEVFFPNLRLRAVLLKHLFSLGVFPEFEGVPSDFAAPLFESHLLDPVKLVTKVFMPTLNGFAEQACSSMLGMSDAEIATSALLMNPVDDSQMNALDSFNSYGFAGRDLLSLVPKYTKYDAILRRLLEEAEPVEPYYDSFVEEMKVKVSAAAQKFSRGPYTFSADYYADILLSVKTELIQTLTYAALYENQQRSNSVKDFVENFDERMAFHCERLRPYLNTPWILSFELT